MRTRDEEYPPNIELLRCCIANEKQFPCAFQLDYSRHLKKTNSFRIHRSNETMGGISYTTIRKEESLICCQPSGWLFSFHEKEV